MASSTVTSLELMARLDPSAACTNTTDSLWIARTTVKHIPPGSGREPGGRPLLFVPAWDEVPIDAFRHLEVGSAVRYATGGRKKLESSRGSAKHGRHEVEWSGK